MQGGIEIAGLSPIVIPVFISNLGCPHRCIFCDQSQFSPPVPPGEIPEVVEEFLGKCRESEARRRILAFYGGSFTGLQEGLREEYLAVASRLIAGKRIHGAKASTRPDMVSPSILESLKKSGFVELELGVQSMDDRVLASAERGHTAADAVRACSMVRSFGLKLGVQIMPGLPGEDMESFRKTVDAVLECEPDYVRVYPVVVLSGTKLEDLFSRGMYRPLTLQEAVSRTLHALIRFESRGCIMLRMGLPDSPDLRITAGPYHPSFGFLVRSLGYRIMASSLMDQLGEGCELEINPRDVSELLGFKRQNLLDLRFSYSFDEKLPRGYMNGRSVSESACIQLQDILEYIL